MNQSFVNVKFLGACNRPARQSLVKHFPEIYEAAEDRESGCRCSSVMIPILSGMLSDRYAAAVACRENFTPRFTRVPLKTEQLSIVSLWAHRNLFWQLSRDGKRAWFGHAGATIACPKLSLLGHLGGWATPWSAEEMLDGQRQWTLSLHMSELLKTVSRKRRPEEDLRWTVRHVPPTTPSVKGRR